MGKWDGTLKQSNAKEPAAVQEASGYPIGSLSREEAAEAKEIAEASEKLAREAVIRARQEELSRGPKTVAKQDPEEKADRQKKALQRMTVQMLELGAAHGLTPAQVVALKESLDSLGWLPRDLRV